MITFVKEQEPMIEKGQEQYIRVNEGKLIYAFRFRQLLLFSESVSGIMN